MISRGSGSLLRDTVVGTERYCGRYREILPFEASVWLMCGRSQRTQQEDVVPHGVISGGKLKYKRSAYSFCYAQ